MIASFTGRYSPFEVKVEKSSGCRIGFPDRNCIMDFKMLPRKEGYLKYLVVLSYSQKTLEFL